MASVVIYLSTGRKFNFSRYIFESLGNEEEQGTDNATAKEPVTAVDDVANQSIQSSTPLTPPPQQPQDIPSTSHVQSPPPQQQSPPPAQPQGAYFPMSLLQKALDACVALTRRVEHLEHDKRIVSSDDNLMEDADIYHIDIDHAAKVLSMQEDESKVQKAVEVVTTAKLITEVVAAVSETVSAAAVIPSVVPKTNSAAAIPTVTALSIKVVASVKADLQEEFNQDIDWEAAIDHVKQRVKEEPFIQRYQVIKKMPQTEAQARRNMMMYLKNTAGFTLDYFKGMSYDDIRLIFVAKFNANIEFLLKSKEQIEEEESRAITSINKTLAQKAAKRRKLIEEAKEAESIKQHLQ
nr:hypothetical protein [Tanacetum cinerariifolium]